MRGVNPCAGAAASASPPGCTLQHGGSELREPRARQPCAGSEQRLELSSLQSSLSCFVLRLWLNRFSLSPLPSPPLPQGSGGWEGKGRKTRHFPGQAAAPYSQRRCACRVCSSVPGSWPPEHPSPPVPISQSPSLLPSRRKVENSHRCCWILQILLIPSEGLTAKSHCWGQTKITQAQGLRYQHTDCHRVIKTFVDPHVPCQLPVPQRATRPSVRRDRASPCPLLPGPQAGQAADECGGRHRSASAAPCSFPPPAPSHLRTAQAPRRFLLQPSPEHLNTGWR